MALPPCPAGSGFPEAGDYRIFVQVKRKGAVMTAEFDAAVQ